MESFHVSLAAGAVSLIACVVLLYYYYRTKRLLDEIWAVDTYSAVELRRMCSGGFNAVVEVEGQVSCKTPVVSYAAQIPCCWFRTRVEREVRKTTYSRSGAQIRLEWECDMDRTRYSLFEVTDETGPVTVDPTKSDMDTEHICSRVTEERFSWFEGVRPSDTGRYRITEEAFLPTGYAFVHGEACESDGRVFVTYPEKGYLDPKARLFIISRKNEGQLVRSKGITQQVCFWGSILAFFALVGSAAAAYFNYYQM